MARGSVFQPDPRTQRVAARLMADAMGEVAQGMLAGRDHDAERDRVLHDLAPAWVKVAGKEAADAAVRGLHFLDPDAYLRPHERDALRRHQADERRALRDHQAARAAEYRAYLAEHAPHLLPKRRPAIRAVAMVILWLALASSGLLAGSSYLAAREAPSRWRALAECGVAKGADYERKCRQFSRNERSTWRAYDGPGAGAPREWEISRPYD